MMGNWIPNDSTVVAEILKISSAYSPHHGFPETSESLSSIGVLWCRGTELNCRHQPFQGCALPTELPRHAYFLQSLHQRTVPFEGLPPKVPYNRFTSVVCCPSNSIATCCLAPVVAREYCCGGGTGGV